MMEVFISWSGERSKLVGLLLKKWIRCVLQASRPWMSDVDIDRGSIWFSEISKELNVCINGIICLTKENINRPWLLFEAGALAKGIDSARVCTFLIDLQPKDVLEPLSHFNHSLPQKESMFKLVKTLNARLENQALPNEELTSVFNTYWPQFEDEFKEILQKTKEEKLPERNEADILGEVLSAIRRFDKRLYDIEIAQEKVTVLAKGRAPIANCSDHHDTLSAETICKIDNDLREMIHNGGMNRSEMRKAIIGKYHISDSEANALLRCSDIVS